MAEANILQSRLDTRSEEYLNNLEAMQSLWDLVADELQKVPTVGGQRYVDRHRRRGKMLVRERVEALVDRNSPLLELNALAGWGTEDPVGVGVFAGIGVIEGIGGLGGICVLVVLVLYYERSELICGSPRTASVRASVRPSVRPGRPPGHTDIGVLDIGVLEYWGSWWYCG